MELPYTQHVLVQYRGSCSQYLLGMEYASTVGMMLMDEVVETNECVSNQADMAIDWAQEALGDCADLDCQLKMKKERVDVLVECVQHLEAEWEGFWGSIVQLKEDNFELWTQMVEMQTMVRELQLWRISMQHGPHNPIIIKDDNEEVADSEEEGEWPDFPEEHHLVEIAEGPWAAALEFASASSILTFKLLFL